MKVIQGKIEYFPGISSIPYEGVSSKNPLAFHYYDENKKIAGKTMKEHLRYAVCYWHTFCGNGGDPFGSGPRPLPWMDSSDPMQAARDNLDAAFEFITKLGAPFWTFHDRDIAPEGSSVAESEKNLAEIVKLAKEKQAASGVKLLWGTANLFSHPRFMNGASTNPDFNVLAYGAAQVKSAIDATIELAGEGYVFWGGREGYTWLFNTDMKRELAHMGRFLTIARDYARSKGFKGVFYIEPKPCEPSTHQYDFDAATVIGFLRSYGIEKDFKLNIENNHATLAGHTFAHDLQVAADAGMLGSIDANRGNLMLGWDTDQFPVNLYDAVEAMIVVLRSGGLTTGGLNFDAKVRRNSTDLEDAFIGHIGGMDTFARALEIASKMLADGDLDKRLKNRYASFDSGAGKDYENGKLSLADLHALALKTPEPKLVSGKQELLENLFNDYIR